ncbi:MAG: TlpA family protein disulfide reductase [Clostridia bacterium]|nr:TlpA family protein disulfide reductase [Clostridia bacterium]
MKKSLKIIAAATAVLLTLGVAGCDKATYPDFYNPTDSTTVIKSEKYVVNVQSAGGLPLDGVQVTASNGTTVRRGISKSGKIEFDIPLGEYDIKVDASTLPDGYYLEDNVSYKTNPDKREEITVAIPSKVITDGNANYVVGSIMKDFTFTDCFNTRYTLSTLLKTKKAVVINFFYTGCNPCRAEFPAIQTAYAGRSDVEILAICSTHDGDTNADVQTFKEGLGLTFPMGVDTIGMNANFGVRAWPTTVVIDRYGLIAYKSSGTDTVASNWTKLFNDFTSDNYKQNLIVGGNPGDPGIDPTPIPKPDIQMPASSVMGAAANGTNFSAIYTEEQDEYSWPWITGTDANGDTYIQSSNKGKHNSYAIVNLEFEMKANQVLTFDYNVSSEADKDVFHILLDGEPMSGINGLSATNGWVTTNLYVAEADKTVVLSFVYQKDAGDPDGLDVEDVAKVREIHLEDISAIREPLDVLRPCASGLKTGSTTYENYVEIEENLKPGEKFYHTKGGALVYITLNQLTQWTDLHANGSTSVSPSDNTTYYNTLYYMTYYLYSQHDTAFKAEINGKDFTDTILTYWGIQGYMEGPYYLLPLTKELKEWAEAFTTQHQKDNNRLPNADEWKEFCYYYDHYGSENNAHTKEGDHCRVTTEVTKGLTINNPYKAYEKSELANTNDTSILNSATYNKATGRNKAVIDYPLAINNGAYYEFTPAETGIYQIRAYTKNCSSARAVPGLTVYHENGSIYSAASDEPRALDAHKYPENYDGFSHFVKFEAGKTYYLHLGGSNSETSYYDFEIEYLNKPTHTEMYVATTGGGIWTVNPTTNKHIYAAVSVTYDDASNCYYRADARGNAIFEQPIYIDMVHHSYFMSNLAAEGYNFATLETLVEDEIFKNRIPFGASYQTKMRRYLANATEGKESDPLYGLVPANKEIVDILKNLLKANVDNTDTSTNGWLMFACYEERFGF